MRTALFNHEVCIYSLSSRHSGHAGEHGPCRDDVSPSNIVRGAILSGFVAPRLKHGLCGAATMKQTIRLCAFAVTAFVHMDVMTLRYAFVRMPAAVKRQAS